MTHVFGGQRGMVIGSGSEKSMGLDAMRGLACLGVDAIVTNRTDLLREVLQAEWG
ncbi:hypothetical protein ACFLT5_02255 [Chloroflexota bacterium]